MGDYYMENLKRYNILARRFDSRVGGFYLSEPHVEINDTGGWVKFSDHVEALRSTKPNKQSLQLLSDKIHAAVLRVTGDQPETENLMEAINAVLAQQ